MEGTNQMINTGANRLSREGGPGVQTMNDPSMQDLERIMDPQLQSATMDDEFNRFKAEQRTLLEQKNQIQKRIESMRREYDFIQNLDARDVNYVVEKKKEHAAIVVQRNYRRLRAEREYRKSRLGKLQSNVDYEKTEDDLKRIQETKDDLERLRAYYSNSRKDHFYDKIKEDRLHELKEQVSSARKLRSEHEINQLNTIEIFDEYLPRVNRFNDQFGRYEAIRAQGHDQLMWTEVMTKFMVQVTPEEMSKANEPIPHTEDEALNERRAREVEDEAAARLRKIKRWDEVADNFTNEDKTDIIKQHKERLARHRKRKDWEAWIEKDDLDLDGDRIISEIKNYKSEHFWNTKFYN